MKKSSVRVLSGWMCAVWVIVFAGCAAQGPPGGGPEDREGPVLVSSLPEDMATNVSALEEVVLEFSEPIRIKNAVSRLMILPTLRIRPEVIIKGRKVIIRNIKGLRKNTTYIVSFGRSVQDIRGNFVEKEVRIAFSTGDSIDNGSISGTIYNFPENLNCFVLAYKFKDSFPDTLLTSIPDYICQIGENGGYEFRNLSPGRYRLLAVCTELSNPLKIRRLSYAGVSSFDYIDIKSPEGMVGGVNFVIQEVDLTPFQVVSCRLDRGVLRVRFSHKLKEELLASAIIDVLGSDSVKVRDKWVTQGSEDILNVSFEVLGKRLTGGLVLNGLMDIYDTVLIDTILLDFLWEDWVDSTPPFLIGVSPKDKASNVDPDEDIRLDFSEPIVVDTGGIEMLMDSVVIQFNKRFLDGNSLILEPLAADRLGREFIIQIDGRNIRDLSGLAMSDTVSFYSFETISLSQTGSISGKLVCDIDGEGHLMLEVLRVDGKFGRVAKADRSGNFLVERLLPGEYSLFVWLDRDGDCVFDPGKVFPYVPSEPFWFPDGKVRVRARWETAGLEVGLD